MVESSDLAQLSNQILTPSGTTFDGITDSIQATTAAKETAKRAL